MRRAVITGVGSVSGFGVGQAALAAGLRSGASAVRPLTVFDAREFPCQVGGEVPLDAAALRQEVAARTTWIDEAGALRDRKVGLAAIAALDAWRAAGLHAGEVPGAWVSLGVGVENALFADLVGYLVEPTPGGRPALDWTRDAAATGPRYRGRSPLERVADVVAQVVGARGHVVTHSSACAAGGLAVAHAAALIERGAAEVVLAGGADSMLNPGGFGGMAVLGTTSPRAASDACRPFDRRRDGIAIGEGAALFVIEERAHARARGATILAEVRGWGSTQDAHRPSAPEPSGALAAAAMAAALRRAGVVPTDIGYLSAHGTGTTLNDVAEARAIRQVFGAHADTLPVSSIKGATGHLMAASGAIELAAALLALRDGYLAGTCNHHELDEECPIRVLGPRGEMGRPAFVLSNSFGFGGQNVALVIGAEGA